jgi:hypothetical protein
MMPGIVIDRPNGLYLSMVLTVRPPQIRAHSRVVIIFDHPFIVAIDGLLDDAFTGP